MSPWALAALDYLFVGILGGIVVAAWVSLGFAVYIALDAIRNPKP